MNRLLLIAALALLAALTFGWFLTRRAGRKLAPSGDTEAVTAHLREMALTTPPDQIGIGPPSTQHGVWGVIADISLPDGTATVVAFADGTASIYWGSSGGIIGGQDRAQVRVAAKAAVNAMEKCAGQMAAGVPQALPHLGGVRFYARARAGLLVSDELSQDTLAAGNHPMSPCFLAMNDLITQLRVASSAGV